MFGVGHPQTCKYGGHSTFGAANGRSVRGVANMLPPSLADIVAQISGASLCQRP